MDKCELPIQNNAVRQVLFKVPIDSYTMDEVLQKIHSFIQSKSSHLLVTADSAGVMMAQSDPEFLSILQGADLITPDSMGILWALKRLNGIEISRVSGVDLTEEICKRSHQYGYRIFFLGAAHGIAKQASERLKSKYPNCQIVGTHHGYFEESFDLEIARKIAATKPDVLFVAMGMPRQEKFIQKTREIIKAPVAIGIGGSLDVFSGSTKRAPKWAQEMKIEWLWRYLLNPRKTYKIKLLPKFVFKVLRSKM